MTHDFDPVDEVLDAYLDFLEHGGDEPSLDHLTATQRAEAERLIASLKAGRGIDPQASRPSIAALLAHEPARMPAGDIADVVGRLEADLHDELNEGCDVVPDIAARASGIDSDLIITCRGHRLRGMLEPADSELNELTPRRISAAAAIFGAFGETAGILLMTKPPMVGVIIERSDLEAAFEVPSGQSRPPRIARPIAAAAVACAAFINELAPSFTALDADLIRSFDVGSDAIDVPAIVRSSVLAVAAQGARAQITEKRMAWSDLGDTETTGLARLISDLESGVASPEDLPERLGEIVGALAA
ncbi:MAG: hypothetical protein P1T08_08765 [Acidimicrobiia bacterium]|nr:hypothetical protein [Acidimicrobiia bacterium]